MIPKRPPALVYLAACQVLLGLIELYHGWQYGHPVLWIALSVVGVWHLVTAVGLYNLNEWARQRAVQLSVFDLLRGVQGLFPYPNPLATLLQIGIPLYTVTVLSDRRLRSRFS